MQTCENCYQDTDSWEFVGKTNKLLCEDCQYAWQDEANEHRNKTGERLNCWGNPTYEDGWQV